MTIMLVDKKIFLKSEHTHPDVLKRIALYREVYDFVNTWETPEAWIAQGVILARKSVEADSSAGDVPVEPVPVPAPALAVPMPAVDTADVGQRVVEAAARMIDEEQTADHCWDWVNDVYSAAGVGRRQIWPEEEYVYSVPGRDITAMDWYSPADNLQRLSEFAPGDWIFINNRNTSDVNGNHSAIFINWQDPENTIARVAQLPRGRREPPKYKAYNLVDMPLAHHSQPID